ncbi:MAG: hypothetical protein ROR55_21445 [Devosia sp.]
MDSDIKIGRGENTIVGLVKISAGADSVVDQVSGIRSSLTTTIGNELIVGRVAISARDESITSTSAGIRLDAPDGGEDFIIDTGPGNDRVVGFVRYEDIDPDLAFGSGIVGGQVFTGRGNDQVVGIGADVDIFGVSNSSQSIGLEGVEVNTGAGHDLVKSTGGKFGISETIIAGGAGNDTFNLQNGIGDLNGGRDVDTLMLQGRFRDYTFIRESPDSGRITSDDGTDILVTNVEFFDFERGRSFTEGDLFG